MRAQGRYLAWESATREGDTKAVGFDSLGAATTLERQRFRSESSAKQTELLDCGAGIPVEMTSRS